MIGMLHPALKLLSWFFRWPLQNILYDSGTLPSRLLPWQLQTLPDSGLDVSTENEEKRGRLTRGQAVNIWQSVTTR